MKATRLVLLGVTVALGLLIAAQAMASDARLESMALQREYVEDYFNFRTFPTVAARFSNLATVALGSSNSSSDFGSERSVGVIGAGDNTSYGVFAVYLNEAVIGGSGADHAQFDITWAKDFEKTAIGLGMLYQNSSVEQGGVKVTPIDFTPLLNSMNQLFFTGGVKFAKGEKSTIELAAKIGWLTYGDSLLIPSAEDAGKVSYNLAGRVMAEISDKTTLIPLLQYGKMDATGNLPPTGTEQEFSETQLNAGLAVNYEVNGSDLLVLGISADYTKLVDEPGIILTPGGEVSDWSIPTLFLATEFDVYSWLTLRAGARKTFDNATVKDLSPIDTDVKSSSYTFGLGMGLHFDHFDVDASLNPDWIFTGGYFLSGQTTESIQGSTQPLTRVTATYYF